MEVDRLTGVGSSAWFEKLLAAECRHADAVAAPLSLICIDIDHFGDFAAHNGHQVADLELIRIARTLQHHVGSDKYLARLGDDEFAVLLPGTDAAQAAEVAERCRSAVQVDPTLAGEIMLSVSIGFVTSWRRRMTGTQLLQAAHAALAEAKSGGGNLVAMYRPSATS